MWSLNSKEHRCSFEFQESDHDKFFSTLVDTKSGRKHYKTRELESDFVLIFCSVVEETKQEIFYYKRKYD